MTLSRKTGPETPAVTPAELRAMLKDGGEIALLDVREEGVFSEEGHPFFANSLPLSRLELLIRDLVPRQLARIVVYDGGDENLAERAAATMTTIMPESGSGDWRRRIASQAIPPVMTSRRTAFPRATRIVLPRNP